MAVRVLESAEDLTQYADWVKNHPQGNLWQSVERLEYIRALGKRAKVYINEESGEWKASALISIDSTTGGLSTWSIPRGPLWTDETAAKELIDFLLAEAKRAKVLSVYISPTLPLLLEGWHPSNRLVYAEATRILDLTKSEEEILKQMHQKGRYNIKVAEKNGITVKQSDDIASYVKLAKQTAARDQFVAVSEKHYATFLQNLPGSFLLLAYSPDSSEPIAGLLGVISQKMGIYYYGASDYEHRALMAPYLLQWEAIKYCKKAGCEHYDLLGIAPIANPPISGLRSPVSNHPWNGISDFKAKFGGTVVTYPAEQERVLRPVVKRLLEVKRRILG